MVTTIRSCRSQTLRSKSIKLPKNGRLKVYKGFPHGMLTTHADVINPELLAFIKG